MRLLWKVLTYLAFLVLACVLWIVWFALRTWFSLTIPLWILTVIDIVLFSIVIAAAKSYIRKYETNHGCYKCDRCGKRGEVNLLVRENPGVLAKNVYICDDCVTENEVGAVVKCGKKAKTDGPTPMKDFLFALKITLAVGSVIAIFVIAYFNFFRN